jgi:acyl homoserine lactone synthase
MIKVLSGFPPQNPIFDEMFRGRAVVFRDRLKWLVTVQSGREIDEYDRSGKPVYLVALDIDDHVVGSLRALPTTGPTMLKSEFGAMFQDDVDIDCATTWECTRFCVHPAISNTHLEAKGVALELLAGLCDFALWVGIQKIFGVYDASMERVYRRLGWSPTQLSKSWPQFGNINCGIWEVSDTISSVLRGRLADIEKPPSFDRNGSRPPRLSTGQQASCAFYDRF